jgi:large subunit ribosomal protein L18e
MAEACQNQMKRTGPTNPELINLIQELKKKSIEHGVNIWKRVANDLEKPTRKRRIINLYKINKYTKENEIIIVPGKVLAAGDLDHAVTIAAFSFSGAALDKINKVGKIIPINELIKESPKGKRIRIIG